MQNVSAELKTFVRSSLTVAFRRRQNSCFLSAHCCSKLCSQRAPVLHKLQCIGKQKLVFCFTENFSILCLWFQKPNCELLTTLCGSLRCTESFQIVFESVRANLEENISKVKFILHICFTLTAHTIANTIAH
jgi:hypothetical protein